MIIDLYIDDTTQPNFTAGCRVFVNTDFIESVVVWKSGATIKMKNGDVFITTNPHIVEKIMEARKQ